MIDNERRKKLALHLRHLSVGLISNDKFENNVMDDVTKGWLPEQYRRSKKAKFDDKVIVPMLELCWGLYDDTRNHKLTGKDQLSKKSLKIIACCILFLHSEIEYEWPDFDFMNPLFKFSVKELFMTILTFGKYYRDKRQEQKQSYLDYQELGTYECWPFFKLDDYNEQLTKQPFLSVQEVD
jgi:hypothetical protein